MECIRRTTSHHLLAVSRYVQFGIFISRRWFASIPYAMTAIRIGTTVEPVNSAQTIFQFLRIDGGTQIASVSHEFILKSKLRSIQSKNVHSKMLINSYLGFDASVYRFSHAKQQCLSKCFLLKCRNPFSVSIKFRSVQNNRQSQYEAHAICSRHV